MLATANFLILDHPVVARPYPDQLGICYVFRGDEMVRREPCVISSGYGAGSHYASLNWLDGKTTSIYKDNSCNLPGLELNGFCSNTVNDAAAEYYERNAFLVATEGTEAENMPCYLVSNTEVSFCYRVD
jgi:hypothetical protein